MCENAMVQFPVSLDLEVSRKYLNLLTKRVSDSIWVMLLKKVRKQRKPDALEQP